MGAFSFLEGRTHIRGRFSDRPLFSQFHPGLLTRPLIGQFHPFAEHSGRSNPRLRRKKITALLRGILSCHLNMMRIRCHSEDAYRNVDANATTNANVDVNVDANPTAEANQTSTMTSGWSRSSNRRTGQILHYDFSQMEPFESKWLRLCLS